MAETSAPRPDAPGTGPASAAEPAADTPAQQATPTPATPTPATTPQPTTPQSAAPQSATPPATPQQPGAPSGLFPAKLPVAAPVPAATAPAKWPRPESLGGWTAAFAVLLGALSFAVFVPLSRVGVGWLIGGLIATIGVATVAKRTMTQLPVGEKLIRAGWGVSALALLSVLAFRNAWWLVTFCVMAAIWCAVLAVTGARSIRSIIVGALAVLPASVRGLVWVLAIRKAAPTPTPTRPAPTTPATPSRSMAAPRLVVSAGVTALLLLIFGALFASADAAFAQVLANIVPEFSVATMFRSLFLFLVGGAATSAAVFMLASPVPLASLETPGTQRLRSAEWGLPIGGLVALFTFFVIVQGTVLFGGARHVLTTAGLTYAEYARTGFWQLTIITLLTLAVVGAVARWAERITRTDRISLRVLLGALSVLTLVVVASALRRMYIYQQAYSFTGERIFVMAFELLLGCVFLAILVAGIRLSGAWLPRAMAAGVVVMLLSLAVFNPELYAARRNIQRFEQTQAAGDGKIDLWYLRALSADATPALVELPLEMRRCALMWITPELKPSDPWYGWNLGREQARSAIAKLGKQPNGTCAKAKKWDYRSSD